MWRGAALRRKQLLAEQTAGVIHCQLGEEGVQGPKRISKQDSDLLGELSANLLQLVAHFEPLTAEVRRMPTGRFPRGFRDQTDAMRQHNRHSVRPILQLHRGWPPGGRAGIRLINSGLGPAVIVDSTLSVDCEVLGAWNAPSVDRVRDRLPVRPSGVTFNQGEVIATDYEQYLLSVARYDPQNHADVENLINRRLTLKIRYESLYGGENYTAVLRPIR